MRHNPRTAWSPDDAREQRRHRRGFGRRLLGVITTLAVLVAGSSTLGAPAWAETTAPWIQSDKEDYAPGELVTLTGGGWQAGESVHIFVDDDQTKSWKRNVDVTADGSGNIRDQFNLPDWFVATYQVVATGSTSGTATTMFTDGNARFVTSGPTINNVAWTKYSTSNCSGGSNARVDFGTGTMTPNAGGTLGLGVVDGQSVQLTVPATAGSPTQNFSAWSAKNASDPFTASGDGSRTICVPGFLNGNRDYQATYVTPPAIATTALQVAPAEGPFGGTVTLSATLTSGGNAVSGKTVSFKLNSASVGTATTSTTGVATLTGVSLAGINAGGYNSAVAASFAGDSTHGSSSGTGSLTVAKAGQATLAVTGPSAGAYNETLAITTSGGSGTGTVSYARTGDACDIVDGNKVKITKGSGTCSLTGTKAADDNYLQATSAPYAVSVGKAAQAAVTVTGADSGAFGDKLTYTVTGGSGNGAVTLSASGACKVEADKVEFTAGSGICTVTGTKAGDANYDPASGSKQVSVTKAAQADLTISGPGSAKYDEQHTYTVAGGNGGGALTWAVDGNCVLVAGSVRITAGSGICTVNVTKASDENYLERVGTKVVALSKASATLTLTDTNKVYNGAAQAPTFTSVPQGLEESATLTYDGNASAPKSVGSYAVSVGLDHPNYEAEPATGTFLITAKVLTGSFIADDKEYDGTTAATVKGSSLSGVVTGDVVTVSVSGAEFADKNVGTHDVTAGLSLGGAQAGNYSVSATATAKAAITAKALTVTGITAAPKTWDGSTSVTLQTGAASLVGAVTGDDVALVTSGATGTSSSAAVGTHTVSITGLAVSGGDKGNYSLTQPTTTVTIGAWTLNGFYSPIGEANSTVTKKGDVVPAATTSTVWNTAKGGSTIPLKFNVARQGVQQTSTGKDVISSFTATKLPGCTGTAMDGIEELSTAGSTSLRYEGGQYIQNWKTSTVSGNTCYRVALTTADESVIYTFVQLRK